MYVLAKPNQYIMEMLIKIIHTPISVLKALVHESYGKH